MRKEIEQEVKQQRLQYYESEIAKTKLNIVAFQAIGDEENLNSQKQTLEKWMTIYKAVGSYEYD